MIVYVLLTITNKTVQIVSMFGAAFETDKNIYLANI